MKLCVLFALIVSLVLLIAVSALTQTLEEAQQAASKMGYTGEMKFNRETNGVKVFSGDGLSVEYGGAIPGMRMLHASVDSELNQDASPIRSSEEAVVSAKAFITRYGAAIDVPAPPEGLSTEVKSASRFGYSGWDVDLYAIQNGHRSLPEYTAAVDSGGGVVHVMYIPLCNEVPTEAKIALDAARDILLRREGMTGSFSYKVGELRVVPDLKGGCVLVWMMELWPSDRGRLGVAGTVDATTGDVVWSAKSGGRVPPLPTSLTNTTKAVPPATKVASATGSLVPSEGTTPSESASPTSAFALLALAALLLIFLMVKLRKR